MIRPTHRNRRHPPEPGVILNPEPRAVPLNRRHPEPGFSRVKDLARSGTDLGNDVLRASVRKPDASADLYQVAGLRHRRRRRKLRRAPRVEDGYLVHAGDSAVGSTGFFRQIFAANVFSRVFLQRNGGIAALLRAIVHQAIFANVEIARPGAAAPLIRAALRNIVLEAVDRG